MHLVGVTDCRPAAVQPNWVERETRTGEMQVLEGVVVVVVAVEAVGIRGENAVADGGVDGDVGSFAIDQCAVDAIVSNVVLLDRFRWEFGIDEDDAGGVLVERRCA